MTKFSDEFKRETVAKLLLEGGPSVAALSKESGVGESTLFRWRMQSQRGAGGGEGAGRWSGKARLAALMDTAALNAAERAAYCREHGLYAQQLEDWQRSFEGSDSAGAAALTRERQRVRALERELRRKERALAEAAALLVLSKKAQAIWGVSEAD